MSKKSWIAGAAAPALAAFLLPLAYVSYRKIYCVRREKTQNPYRLPKGEQFEERKEQMVRLIDHVASLPYEEVYAESFDGLKLFGRYYEIAPDAPVQILFHGYHSSSLRDFSGGLPLALKSGCNVLLVDQRAHGRSEGKILTMGIWERKDVLTWVRWVLDRQGEQTKIVLTGVSMGAATVLMASGLDLPEQVKGIIADSGYSSQKEIICKVMKDFGIPRILYPFTRLGAGIFGHFDPDETSAEKALKGCKVPVLFIHGEDDRFVPCEMSRKNYKACAADKTLLTVPGAGHGISYLVDYDRYAQAVQNFLHQVLA